MEHDEEKAEDELIFEEDEDGVAEKIKKLREKMKTCERERKEYLEGWQRAKADLINYKKDEERRLEDLGRFLHVGVLEDLLPVLDSFDLALQSFKLTGDLGKSHEQGVLMIRSQLLDILKKRGVMQISVHAGETFSPERHESIGEVASNHAAGTIAEEVQKGYMIAERVIRPARVRIAK